MRHRPPHPARRFVAVCLLLAGGAVAAPAAAAGDDEAVVRHVLNRLAFGPRAGQVEAVREAGWRAWFEAQLDPASVPDDRVERTVASRWPSMRMSMAEAFAAYRPPYSSDPPAIEEQQRNNRLAWTIRRELAESVVYRAVFSERQFQEVIVEFWRNHLTVDQNKDDVGYLANHYEQEVIRRFAFGKFEHMLLASARHPAMLIYLDNIVSQRPLTEREEALVAKYEGRDHVPRSVAARQRQRGLNENYARELMELHTLGVDNGYTQRDVTELARVLTGWTAGWGDDGSYGFRFRPEVHDDGEKRLLGARLVERGGEAQGIDVIRSLARHPRTADFIAVKLCRYLVHDDPSEALVRRVAGVFRRTGGDLPAVYRAIVFSDEFLRPEQAGAKFKTPFEYVISSLRATGAEVESYDALLHALRHMGQPVYGCEDPNGYDDRAERWLDPGVLVHRWTYALSLAGGSLSGVSVPDSFIRPLTLLPPESLGPAVIERLAPTTMDERGRQLLLDAIAADGDAPRAVALVIGSPAFQRQ